MLNILLVIEFISAAVVFILLFFVNAPYGRFVRKGWGPTIPARYGWMIMEFPAFFVLGWIVLANLDKAGAFGIFALMWEAHYFYRVFVYPFIMTSPRKPFPVLLVFFAVCFNTVNGAANGLSLNEKAGFYLLNAWWLLDIRFWVGLVLFITGFGIHAHSDKVLRILRRQGKGEYLVPAQGMFRWVSSPNYLGEIVEWAGFAVATWSLAGAAFAIFTVANLLPRAVSNHRWYKKTFPEYPPGRKILLPFIW